jgi:hypothetical protein
MTKRLKRDDTGAALVLVLIVITVIFLVTSAVLSFSDTSIRTTVALRDQAATAYASDGAAQVAIATLQMNSYNGGDNNCFGGNLLNLTSAAGSPFYSSHNGKDLSAAVQCDSDLTSGNGGVKKVSAPATSLLAMGTSPTTSVDMDVSAAGSALNVGGKVFSNSQIKIDNKNFNNVRSNGSFWAKGGASGCIGKGSTTVQDVITSCNAIIDDGSSAYTGYFPTIDGAATIQTLSCNNTTLGTGKSKVSYTVLSPGVYTSASALSNCSTALMWFQPGEYYFNFTGSSTWTMNSPVVAGTLTSSITDPGSPLLGLSSSSPQGQCKNPLDAIKNGQTPSPGAEFVFGGSSSFTPNLTFFEICGLYDSGNHVIAIYGLSSPIMVGSSITIPAQPSPVSLSTRCGESKDDDRAFIYTSYGNSFNMFILGTTYAPRACLDIEYQNGGVEVFHFGLVAWQFYFNVNGSSSATPFVNVDDITTSTSAGPTYALLRVYAYLQGAPNPCSASGCSGTPSVVVKVKIPPSDGSGSRTVGVLSWSDLR